MSSSNIDLRNSIDRSPVLQSTRNRGSKLRFAVRACATTALLVIGLTFAFRALLYAQSLNLTGTYMADDGGVYYVQQSGNTVWWAGMSLDSELPPDAQWHRGLTFTNVFRGTINNDGTVVGDWCDVTRGSDLKNGTLTVKISGSSGSFQFSKITQTGGFGASSWTQTAPLDDTKVNGVTRDIFSRFDAVHKNDDTTLLNPNLKPYRDATVFYARVINSHLEYLSGNPVESEVPHVNYGPEFSPQIPSFRDFGHRDREFHSFVSNNADGDGDFDMRLKVDLNKLEPNFYDVGWENHQSAPDILRLKLNDTTVRQKLNFSSTEGYSGAETIMFGRPPDCTAPCPCSIIFGCTIGCSIDCHSDGGVPLLPSWADLFENSVLINGRPINGLFDRTDPTDPEDCNFNQPCPYLAGETPFDLGVQKIIPNPPPFPPTVILGNYLVAPIGIRLKSLLLSAYGNGQIGADETVGDGVGTYVRITGALILDCGHGLTHDCFDDPSDPGDVSAHSNQEIHPVYSIDVINYPFRPEDSSVSARPNLTGAWGGNDGSTYYVRQIGNTLWFLGLLRDRQPNQQATSYDLIGTPQVAAAALLVGSPVCSSGTRCWMFGTVFKGTVSQNSDGTTTIQGDWAGVPQSTSPGSTGSSVTFSVDAYHKVMTPTTLQGLFPTKLEKLYEPEDTTPPSSTLTIGSPQYPVGSSQPFVTAATSFSVTATDDSSGVENIWYRFFPSGSANPPSYTAVVGSTATFTLSGPDGLYEVDTYATDNAGNDETPVHVQLVYLDNTAPVATIVQPTATQYLHSDTFTISYSVSDGTGSGVKSATPNIDSLTTLHDGTTPVTVANGLTVKLLTELTVGTHTFNVYSVDNINNAGTNSVTFSIVVTAQSIIADVKYFRSIGAITQDEATSLLSKLNSAAKARAKGDCPNAATIYTSFISELQAQSGKKVSAQAAAIMIADAQYLIAHCP